jgi:hypothetical protein
MAAAMAGALFQIVAANSNTTARPAYRMALDAAFLGEEAPARFGPTRQGMDRAPLRSRRRRREVRDEISEFVGREGRPFYPALLHLLGHLRPVIPHCRCDVDR